MVSAGLVLGVAHVRLREPLWETSPENYVLLAGLAVAHAASAAVLLWRARREGVRFSEILLTVGLAYGGLAFALVMAEARPSRPAVIGALVASIVANTVTFARPGRRLAMALVAAQFMVVGALSAYGATLAGAVITDSRTIATIFYPLELRVHERMFSSDAFGGGIDAVGNGMLLTTGEGQMRFIERVDVAPGVNVRALPYRVPVNRDRFVRDTEEGVAIHNFRVADTLVRMQSDSLLLLASHHYWYADRECFVLRLSVTNAETASFLAGTADITWRTVYETRPCMPLKPTEQGRFGGDQVGGRLVWLDSTSVLLAVGDQAHDGWNSDQLVSQDSAGHWGKTVRIDLADGTSEIHSTGHRNPQGLTRTAAGLIWSTEHGAKGGDELNLIERGANYGWPYVTLGADYEQFKWPLSSIQGRHAGFEQPRYAWLPSIGVSNVIDVRSERFATWRGDLLVGSLAAGTLFRVRPLDGRIQFVEPILIGERIRDLAEGPDGRIYLMFDSGSIGILDALDPEGVPETSDYFTPEMRGQAVFATCATCHAGLQGTAPSLAGVVGRRVAAEPNYPYSAALRDLGGRWTPERLQAFLADPSGFAPGTTMRVDPIRDSTDRASLIAYLRSVR
jgi:cytochrome c2